MKTVLKLEEVGMFVLAIFLFNQLTFSAWWFWILLLTPDVGMLGYLINPKIGAWLYNIFHHKGIAILVGLTGLFLANPYMMAAGIILFGHSAFDRIMGYGLKYETGFKFTHLGEIG